ncbi:MAG TPA: glycoside hydrolase family 36 protein [Candidatus Binataceae bacterium]|nr:glycoside hydrolase family 36 protein [Candidatus Binataceae bacterium]
MLRAIEVRFAGPDGHRAVRCEGNFERSERDGIVITTHRESLDGGCIIHAAIHNRGPSPLRLGAVHFELSTGFSASSPARFFKHGYQSWSASYPVPIGTSTSDRSRPLLVRQSHQSEADRPADMPEAATSELFTIVESDSSDERFCAGFLGAAHQFTTLTVTTPERIVGRAIFDGIRLDPGESREVEPLALWRSNQDAARMASRWAGLLGKRMDARVGAPYQRGWCSWYHYFDAITEDAVRSNLRVLKQMSREYPIEVVQIDDGYQAALGDWDRTNAKFPSGLAALAAEIRDAGFTAGLWTAPFLATRDSALMRGHPGWFIGAPGAEPTAVVRNPSWTAGDDKFAYALDPSHPEVVEHLERLFDRLARVFGYGYLKLDFLFAAAAGPCHDPGLTRAETLRRGLEAIRRGAGNQTFLLGCGCPLGQAVGVVDGMRIGPDVAPDWGGEVEPGTRVAIDAIVARSFMHRRLWLNDPDCLMLRGSETRLTREERFALAAAIAASGGMLLISDDMSLLTDEAAALFRMASEIGTEVDSASYDETPLATTLMANPALKTIETQTGRGRLRLMLNLGETAQSVSKSTLGLDNTAALVSGPDGETSLAEHLVLPAHSARIIRG